MLGVNSVYIYMLIVVIVIMVVANIFKMRDNSDFVIKNVSLFLDKMSDEKDSKEECSIYFDIFVKFKKGIDTFLQYLKNVGYVKSEFFVINKKHCAVYNSSNVMRLCNNYNESKDKRCKYYRKFWQDLVMDSGVLIKYNLLKKENRNEIILYKNYGCKNDDTIIMGFICQDKN